MHVSHAELQELLLEYMQEISREELDDLLDPLPRDPESIAMCLDADGNLEVTWDLDFKSSRQVSTPVEHVPILEWCHIETHELLMVSYRGVEIDAGPFYINFGLGPLLSTRVDKRENGDTIVWLRSMTELEQREAGLLR